MSLPVYVGSTTHYAVQYDSAMNLGPLANAFLSHVEADYAWCRYFWAGVPEPFAGGRVNVFITVTPGLQSATWPLPPPGVEGGQFDITIRVQQPDVDQVLTDVRALFVMELSEQFMMQQGTGWCGGSTTPGVSGKQEGTNGEALSQVFEIEAQRHIDNFTPFNFAAQDWLQSPDRPDAVNSTESPAGSNDYRVGCNVIFIYYLMHQLQFSFAEICAAPGTTLREIYNNLTGTTSDPFPAFRAAIDAAYPIGQPLDPKNVALMSGDLWNTDVLLNDGSGSTSTSGPSLPYFFDFNYNDTPGGWLVGGWVSPGPWWNTSAPSGIYNHQGEVELGASTPVPSQFNARVYTDDAPTYDLRFDYNLSEIAPLLSGPDPNTWLEVRLADKALGTVFYQIYLDNFEFSAWIYTYVYDQSNGYYGQSPNGVPLTGIDPLKPLSIRIQETGLDRYFKVWQGAEPATWTVTETAGHPHTGQRFIDLYVFCRSQGTPNVYFDNIGVNHDPQPTTYIPVTSTAHFNYLYDIELGIKGNTDAGTAASYAEHDLLNHFGWFGSTVTWGSKGPQRIDIFFDGRELINKVAGSLAYYLSGKFVVHFNWDEPTPNVELDTAHEYRAVWMHEIVHHFQNLQGAGHFWDSRSMAEAHAAFLERLFRRDIGDWAALKMGGYAQHVQTWLNSNREDWVNYTVPFDSDDTVFNPAVGCTLLFFNWLHFVHGYSGAQITQAGGNTPRAIYRNLTGNSADPFPRFYNELEREFDPTYQFDLRNYPDIANPYPLTPAKQAAPPPQNTVGNGLIALQQQLVRQQLRQNLRRF